MAGRKEGQREGKWGGEKESRGLRNNEIKDSMVRECALYSVRTAFIYVRSFDLSDSFSTVTCLAFPRDGFKLRTRATLRSYPFRSTRSFCCTIFCRVFLSLSLLLCVYLSLSFSCAQRDKPWGEKERGVISCRLVRAHAIVASKGIKFYYDYPLIEIA